MPFLKVTLPLSDKSFPAIILSMLVFPEPLLAIKATLSPKFKPKLRPENNTLSPYDLLMFSTDK